MAQQSTLPTAQDILKELEAIISPLVSLDVELNVKGDIEPNIEADANADVESDVESDVEPNLKPNVESDIESEVESDAESDYNLPRLGGLEIAKYLKTTPCKPSVTDISNWTISTSSDSLNQVSPATSLSSLGPSSIQATRIRGGFLPLPHPRKIHDEDDFESLLIGSFNGNEVIHVVTGIEKFLNNAETMTSVGRRFLPDEPDKLAPKDEFPKAELTEGKEADTEVESPAQTIGRKPSRYTQFFEIRESPVGGLGAFAIKDLKRGDVILVERPMLKTSSFNLMNDFRALDAESKEIYMNLHAVEDNNTNEIERIKRANGFQLDGGIGIFAIAARFNHGCGPKRNVKYLYDKRRNVMTFVVWHDFVPAGTELLVNYGGSPANLFRTFGFRCNCGGCDGLSDEDVRRLRAEEMGIHLY